MSASEACVLSEISAASSITAAAPTDMIKIDGNAKKLDREPPRDYDARTNRSENKVLKLSVNLNVAMRRTSAADLRCYVTYRNRRKSPNIRLTSLTRPNSTTNVYYEANSVLQGTVITFSSTEVVTQNFRAQIPKFDSVQTKPLLLLRQLKTCCIGNLKTCSAI